MMSNQGIVKIIDFGVAGVTVQRRNNWEFKTTAAVGKKAGSFLYSAPELLLGDNPITSAYDIYALGLIIN